MLPRAAVLVCVSEKYIQASRFNKEHRNRLFFTSLFFPGLPDGKPRCSANSSYNNNNYLMLSCSWEGGSPQALLWWTSNGEDIQSTPEESSSILHLYSSGIYNGKFFICHAKHPLAREASQCVVKLGMFCSQCTMFESLSVRKIPNPHTRFSTDFYFLILVYPEYGNASVSL